MFGFTTMSIFLNIVNRLERAFCLYHTLLKGVGRGQMVRPDPPFVQTNIP